MTELPEALADEAVDAPTGDEASQQCGRCRRVFEMEPTHEVGTMPELWYCANCRVALLGRPTSVVKPPS